MEGERLLSYIKDTASSDFSLFSPKHWITRSHFNDNKLFLPIDHFVSRIKAGGFSIWWEADGTLNGIENELDTMLSTGKNVIISTPFAILSELQQHYPEIIILAEEQEKPLKLQGDYSFEISPELIGTIKSYREIVNNDNDVIPLSDNVKIKRQGNRLINIIESVIKNRKTIEVTLLGDSVAFAAADSRHSSFMVRHTTGNVLIDDPPRGWYKLFWNGILTSNNYLESSSHMIILIIF